MLKSIARFSKKVSKYSYYPILLGFVGLASAFVNQGKPYAILGYAVAIICAVLCAIALASRWLCKKAGIDDKIR